MGMVDGRHSFTEGRKQRIGLHNHNVGSVGNGILSIDYSVQRRGHRRAPERQ